MTKSKKNKFTKYEKVWNHCLYLSLVSSFMNFPTSAHIFILVLFILSRWMMNPKNYDEKLNNKLQKLNNTEKTHSNYVGRTGHNTQHSCWVHVQLCWIFPNITLSNVRHKNFTKESHANSSLVQRRLIKHFPQPKSLLLSKQGLQLKKTRSNLNPKKLFQKHRSSK